MLYARRPDWMRDWLAARGLESRVFDISAFSAGDFEVIVNAIGNGAPGRIKAAGADILKTTERFDRMCLDYLERCVDCAYIFLSTGRVYGADYERAQMLDPVPFSPDQFATNEFYPLAKRKAELRHRDLVQRRIADIRIFGYVSDELGLRDDFLVSQILRALVNEEVFVTTSRDFARDYIGPADLISLIDRLLEARVPNNAYDVYSARPTMKFEMLDALARNCGLRYTVDQTRAPAAEPEHCPDTISRQTAAQKIGYVPNRTSLESVLDVAEAICRDSGKSIGHRKQ